MSPVSIIELLKSFKLAWAWDTRHKISILGLFQLFMNKFETDSICTILYSGCENKNQVSRLEEKSGLLRFVSYWFTLFSSSVDKIWDQQGHSRK